MDWFKKQSRVVKGLIIFFAISASCCVLTLVLPSADSSPQSNATAISETSVAQILVTQENSPSNPTEASTEPPPPTETPSPTQTPTPLPEPIIYEGTGDSVVTVSKPDEAMIVHITGNAGGRYFGITSFDSSGNQIDLLVNTTDPYDGYRPLDFRSNELTTRFQVRSQGAWKIEILPLLFARQLLIPGIIEGTGDDVFLLSGTPDLATIEGNASSRYFGVFSYGNDIDLLVNTTDPYSGTQIIDRSAIVIEVVADGPWRISISAP